MLETHLRQAATILLESTIRIAPPDARDWGRGMLGELGQVEGAWAVAMWAVGGASVLARSALMSVIMPGRGGQNLVPDGGLFARSFPLRKVALVACGVFVMGALLFSLAPPFRQGLRISLTAWRDLVMVAPPDPQRSERMEATESLYEQVFGREVSARNAAVLHISTLALLIFTTMMAIAAAAIARGMLVRARRAAPRSQSIAWATLLAGALGFLISSATIYLTYRPYWYIYQNQILNGSRSRAHAARDYPTVAQSLQYYGFAAANVPVYFWLGLILLGVTGLVLILLRHFLGRPPANAST